MGFIRYEVETTPYGTGLLRPQGGGPVFMPDSGSVVQISDLSPCQADRLGFPEGKVKGVFHPSKSKGNNSLHHCVEVEGRFLKLGLFGGATVSINK